MIPVLVSYTAAGAAVFVCAIVFGLAVFAVGWKVEHDR
jgi:hypothetical protein